MKICNIGGHWATNVGNAFYDLGVTWLLSQVSEDPVYFFPDPPQVYSRKVTKNYDLIARVDADLFIMTGPSWSRAIVDVHKRTFDYLAASGKQIAFVSVGAAEYSVEEADFVADFLSKYPVRFAFTRDRATYDLYSKRVSFPVVDGICTSMFLDNAIQLPNINDDYVVYNFRPFFEPGITQVGDCVEIKSRPFFCLPKYLNGVKIIRAATIPFLSRFPKLSSLAFLDIQRYIYRLYDYHSDLPFGYLSLYKSAKTVFSDRVHSCASTLALGGKAMYIKTTSSSRDGRSCMFSRLKLDDIYSRPVSLDRLYIEGEKVKMRNRLVELLK